MRFLNWLTGLLFVLGIGLTVWIFVSGDSVSGTPKTAAASVVRSEFPEGTWGRIRDSFVATELRLLAEQRDIARRTRLAAEGSLAMGVSALVTRSQAEPQGLLGLLDLLAIERKSLELELLVVVARDGRVYVSEETSGEWGATGEWQAWIGTSGLGSEARGTSADPVLMAVLPPRAPSPHPDAEANPPETGQPAASGGRDLYLVAVVPVSPEAEGPLESTESPEPEALILAGRSVKTLGQALNSEPPFREGTLRWTAWIQSGVPTPTILTGDDAGAPLRSQFVDSLQDSSVTEAPALTRQEPQAGRWSPVRSTTGGVLGGWGVEATPRALRHIVVPQKSAPPPSRVPFLERSRLVPVAGATACLGLACLALAALRSAGRRRFPVKAKPETIAPQSYPSSEPSLAPSPTIAESELLSQFESNWRTFASYTQDMLQRELKSSGVGSSTSEIGEIRTEFDKLQRSLSQLREEFLSDSSRRVQGVPNVPKGASGEPSKSEGRSGPEAGSAATASDSHVVVVNLRKVESDIEYLSSLFSQAKAVAQRTARGDVDARGRTAHLDKIAELESDWQTSFDAILGGIQDVGRRHAALLRDFTAVSESEQKLQLDLTEAQARESNLQTDAEKDRARRELEFRAQTGAVQKERDLVLKLRVAEEKVEQAARRIQELETQLATGASQEVARLRKVEADMERLQGELSNARSRLDQERVAKEEQERQRQLLEKEVAVARETLEKARQERKLAEKYLRGTRDDVVKLEHGIEQASEHCRVTRSERDELKTRLDRARAERRQERNELEAKLAQVEERLAEFASRVRELEHELVAARDKLAEAESRLESARAELADKKGRLAESQRGLKEAERELSGMLARCELLEKKSSTLGDRIQAREEERNALRAKNDEQNAEIVSLKSELEALRCRNGDVESRIVTLQATLHRTAEELRVATEALTASKGELERIRAAKSTEDDGRVRGFQERIDALEVALAEAESRCTLVTSGRQQVEQELRDACARIEGEKAEAQESLSRATAERDDFRRRIEESVAVHANLEATISELHDAHDRVSEECVLRTSEVESLRSELNNLARSRGEIEEERDRIRGERDAVHLELESLRGDVRTLRGDKERLDLELAGLRDEKEKIEVELRSSSERIVAVRQTCEVLKAKCEQAETRRSLEVEETLGRLRDSETRLAEATAREEALTRRLTETEEKLRRAEASLGDKDEFARESAQRTDSLGKLEEEWRLKLADAVQRQSRLEATIADRERRLAESQARAELLEGSLRELDTKSPDETTALVSPPSGGSETWTERERLQGAVTRLEGELLQTRAEIEGIRSFYSVLIEGNIPAAILALDTELKAFAWNPAAERLLGLKRDYVLGRRIGDPELDGFPQDLVELVSRVLSDSHGAIIADRTFNLASGGVCHVRGSCEPILAESGETLGVVLSLEDLTREVESSLDAKCQSLFASNLARSLPVALVVLDRQERVVSWNQAAESLLSVAEPEATGRAFFSLKTPLAKKSFQQYIEKCKQDNETHRIRVRMDVQGETKSYLVTLSPFLGSAGEARGSVLVVQPTTQNPS